MKLNVSGMAWSRERSMRQPLESSSKCVAAVLWLVIVLTANLALGQSIAITRETSPDLPGHNIYRPADMEARSAPLPIITWANGGCVRSDGIWTILFERWASEGFFVITIAQPATTDTEAGSAGRSTADDQGAALDWAFRMNESPESKYAGKLDTKRVIAAGNSCGGITSLALAGRDPRITSVFVLSGSSVGPSATRDAAAAVMSKVSVPVGFVVGGSENIASNQADQDYALLADGLAGMVAKRASGDHRTVSTDPGMLSDAAGIALNWMNASLFDDREAMEALSGTPCSSCAAGLWSVRTKHLSTAR